MKFTIPATTILWLGLLGCASAVPILQNADFSSGLTGWSTLGTVTSSTGGFFGATAYAVLQSGSGVDITTVETALGLSAGALDSAMGGIFSSYTVVYQTITGSYNSSDSIVFDIGGLSSLSATGNAVPAVGIVDSSSGTIANLIGGSGVQLQFLGPPNGTGTDGFVESFGPLSSSSGPQSILLGTNGPALLFALVTESSTSEDSALAFTAVSATPGVPEIASQAGWLPFIATAALLGTGKKRKGSPNPNPGNE